MTPVQTGFICFTMATAVVAWTRGGHPERLAAGATLVWGLTSTKAPETIQNILVSRIPVFELALEFAMLVLFIHMMLRGGRWWPCAAAAVMLLSVLVYFAIPFVPELDRRAEVSAHLGLGFALALTILAGVAERWLAGEAPVSEGGDLAWTDRGSMTGAVNAGPFKAPT